jgi:chemotaxis protein MotB
VAKKAQKKGLPPWMSTFADLCTLLLTFFVLLLTFAQMDVVKFKEMLGSVQQAFGVQMQDPGQFQPVQSGASATAAQPTQHQRIVTAPRPSSATSAADSQSAEMARRMAKQVRTMVQQEGLGEQVEITAGARGIRLRVKGHMLFDAAQAQIKKEAIPLLEGIVQVMDKYDFYLTVEGHTDNIPINTPQFPSNWELSAARSAAVLRTLVKLGVPKAKVSAVGYAANYPLASNQTQEGRLKNRRVEFVFTKRPLRVGVE